MPNLVRTAKVNLERQGFESFFPEFIDKYGKVYPLFKGYAFVKFDINVHQWRSINGTRGVIQIIPKLGKDDFLPKPIKFDFVQELFDKSPVTENNLESAVDRFYPDALVFIKKGLLKDKTGIITKLQGRYAEIFLLELHNKKYSFKVRLEELSLIPS